MAQEILPLVTARVLLNSATQADFAGPVNALLSLLLALATGALGVGLGDHLLALLGIQPASDSERLVLGGGLGLGALAYSLLALGLVGLLGTPALIALAIVALVATLPSVRRYPAYWRKLRLRVNSQVFFERVAIAIVIAMLIAVLLRGLAPVTDYDGLMYHLVVPRDYWRAGRIISYPGEPHGNFPLTVDLLYLPPVALGLESAAKLIHLGFGVLMGIGIYGFARHLLASIRTGWLAVFVLATTPLLGTVAGYAYTDLGWALFEFLSVFALLRWREERTRRWLTLSGIFAGLGCGSKYLGLPVLGVLGLVVLLERKLLTSQDSPIGAESWRRALGDGLLFGFVALTVGSPWYVKNWLWLGNPFYPLWFGGTAWDSYKAASLMRLGTRYGTRKGLIGHLLLPWDLFFRPTGHFGSIPFGFPPPLSLLLPLYLVVRRRRPVNLVLLIVVLRFAAWAVSARNARFLMDVFPLASVAVAYVLTELSRHHLLQLCLRMVLLVLLTANLTWQSGLLLHEDPFRVILGLESQEQYLLDHNDPPYRAIRFINRLPSSSKVLFLGNGQGYYVTTDHVPDITHDNWGHFIYEYGDSSHDLHEALVSEGFTHIFYSGYDFDWHLNFDSDGRLAAELDLFKEFAARCARIRYDRGRDGQVYALSGNCKER